MSNPRPSADFRYGVTISSLHTDNLSLFWKSWIWHFWCRWSSVPLYHVCTACWEISICPL